MTKTRYKLIIEQHRTNSEHHQSPRNPKKKNTSAATQTFPQHLSSWLGRSFPAICVVWKTAATHPILETDVFLQLHIEQFAPSMQC